MAEPQRMPLPAPEFITPPARPRLAEGDVDVWRIDLVRMPGTQLLDDAECARAMRFRRLHDRRRYIAAHVGMREILARYLQCDPAAVYFEPDGEHGKMRLPGPSAPAINLAHSGEIALLCVARMPQVGIDIEHIHPLRDLRDLVMGNFTRAERARLRAQPEPVAAFYWIWTRKEALLKAVGTGLTVELRGVDVGSATRAEFGGREFDLENFTPAADYVAALALPAQPTLGARRFYDHAAVS